MTRFRSAPLFFALISAVTIAAVFEFFVYFSDHPLLFFLAMILSYFFLSLYIPNLPFFSRIKNREWWHWFLPLELFVISAFGFLLFVPLGNSYHFFTLGTLVAAGSYIYFFAMFFRDPMMYDEKKLPNLFSLFSSLNVFFAASLSLLFHMLFNVPMWSAAFLIASVSGYGVYQVLWHERTSPVRRFVYSCVAALCLTEIFWAMSFLGASFLTLAFIAFLVQYMLSFAMRAWVTARWNRRSVAQTFLMGALVFAFIMATSQWI